MQQSKICLFERGDRTLVKIVDKTYISPIAGPNRRNWTPSREKRKTLKMSNESIRRLKKFLNMVEFPEGRTIYAVFTFKDKIDFDHATKYKKRFVERIKRRFKGSGGVFCIEFKHDGRLHYNLIFANNDISISTPDACKILIDQWKAVTGRQFCASECYAKASESVAKTKNYISKNKQKEVPDDIDMKGSFWSHFGVKEQGVELSISQGKEREVREALALEVLKGGSSEGFANAIVAYTRTPCAWIATANVYVFIKYLAHEIAG